MSFNLLDTVLALLRENYTLSKQIYLQEFEEQQHNQQQYDMVLQNKIETLALEKQILQSKLEFLKENKLSPI